MNKLMKASEKVRQDSLKVAYQTSQGCQTAYHSRNTSWKSLNSSQKALPLTKTTLNFHSTSKSSLPQAQAFPSTSSINPKPPLKPSKGPKPSSFHRRTASSPSLSFSSLYKVPHKDVFVQTTMQKRDNQLKMAFDRVMSQKVQKASKLIQEGIKSSLSLRDVAVVTVRLAVVDSVPDVLYLERCFSVKTIVEAYLKIYLSTERYSFGYSAKNNQFLVQKTLQFLEATLKDVIVIKSKRDESHRVFEKFSSAIQYFRTEPPDKFSVHITDCNEVKILLHLFFEYCPYFKQKPDVEYSQDKESSSACNENQASERLASKKSKFQDSQQDSSRGNKANQLLSQSEAPKEAPINSSFPRSKWMVMIDRCLENKDILKAPQAVFEQVFDEFPDGREAKASGQTSLARFKELLTLQIQDDSEKKSL